MGTLDLSKKVPQPKKFELEAVRKQIVERLALQNSFIRFCAYFFKVLEGSDMLINWHHLWFSSIVHDIYDGKLCNVIANVSPGSSKSIIFSSMFPAWCYAKNPHCKFIGISFSEDRVEKNSMLIKDIMESDDYRRLFPGMSFRKDANKKAVWTVEANGRPCGEYHGATMFGQITGNRAGYLGVPGFTGAIIVDDPLKPEDAWSDAARKKSNRLFSGTIRNRKMHARVPIILVMQRLHENDSTGHLLDGGTGDDWVNVVIPARVDMGYVRGLPDNIRPLAERWLGPEFDNGPLASYWSRKEPLDELARIEDSDPYTFQAQYMQDPASLHGACMFPPSWWVQEVTMPAPSMYDCVRVVCDTASKVKEQHDQSVFMCYGVKDGNCYIINIERGKWDANDLLDVAAGFYYAAKDRFGDKLREMFMEDKSSGIGVLQVLSKQTRIPITAVKRGGTNDSKADRARAAQPFARAGRVHIPDTAHWKAAFLLQMQQFNAMMTHKHDDIVDCLTMMIEQEYIKPTVCEVRPLCLW